MNTTTPTLAEIGSDHLLSDAAAFFAKFTSQLNSLEALTAATLLNSRFVAAPVDAIEIVLTLNIGHITETDDDAVVNGVPPPTCLVSGLHDRGYTLLVVPTDLFPAIISPKPGLEAVIEYARSIGCSHIRFDADAGTIDSLPVFEW